MNKMQMAHDAALAMIKNGCSLHTAIADAWAYADAMQVEAEKREDKTRPEVLREWQPDWSQAPDEAKYWMITPNGTADWLSDHPSSDRLKIKAWYAPSFNYQGNWQDSLRKRPQ